MPLVIPAAATAILLSILSDREQGDLRDWFPRPWRLVISHNGSPPVWKVVDKSSNQGFASSAWVSGNKEILNAFVDIHEAHDPNQQSITIQELTKLQEGPFVGFKVKPKRNSWNEVFSIEILGFEDELTYLLEEQGRRVAHFILVDTNGELPVPEEAWMKSAHTTVRYLDALVGREPD